MPTLILISGRISIFRKRFLCFHSLDDFRGKFKDLTLMGRVGEAEEVARVIEFLASDQVRHHCLVCKFLRCKIKKNYFNRVVLSLAPTSSWTVAASSNDRSARRKKIFCSKIDI